MERTVPNVYARDLTATSMRRNHTISRARAQKPLSAYRSAQETSGSTAEDAERAEGDAAGDARSAEDAEKSMASPGRCRA